MGSTVDDRARRNVSVESTQKGRTVTGDEKPAPAFNLEGLLFALFVGVLIWAPFPYGSNRLWAELWLGAALGVVAMLWALAATFGLAHVTSVTRRLLLPALCYGVALGWAVVQTIDLAVVDRTLHLPLAANLAHPVWVIARDSLVKPIGAFVSVDPALTRQAIARAMLSVAAFLLAFELAREGSRARIFLQAIALIAAVYAALGLGTNFAHLDLQSWLMADAPASVGRVAAPFINPNHFATYVGLGTLCALGLLIDGLTRGVVWDRDRKILVRTLLQAITGPLAIWLILTFGLLAALLLSQSRGGIIALLAGAAVLSGALAFGRRRGKTAGGAGRKVVVGLLGVIFAIAIWIGGAPLLGRVAGEDIGQDARKEFALSTVDAIKSAPLLGLGFGAFEHYYPFFGAGKSDGNIDKAHDDYLETIADLGLPAGLAFIAAPLLLGLYCAGGCVRRKRGQVFPAVGLAATVLVGTHAIFDYSLQIPAVAVTYAAILGIGVAQAWSAGRE